MSDYIHLREKSSIVRFFLLFSSKLHRFHATNEVTKKFTERLDTSSSRSTQQLHMTDHIKKRIQNTKQNITKMNTMTMTLKKTTMFLLLTMAAADKHPNDFTQDDVATFLRTTFGDGERGTKLLETFQENEIDGSLLIDLTKDDLTNDLKMTKLQARKFKSSLDKILLLNDKVVITAEDGNNKSESIINKGISADDNNKTSTSSANEEKVTEEDEDNKEDNKTTNKADSVHTTTTTTTTTDNTEVDEKSAKNATDNTTITDTTTVDESSSKDDVNNPVNKDDISSAVINESESSSIRKTASEYCTKLCKEQNENEKYKPVLVHGDDFRQAIKTWIKNPDSSPYGPIIECWDVSNVINMSSAFLNTKTFEGDGSLQCWNTESVKNMDKMFKGAKFNGHIGTWDVSKVTSTTSMFDSAVNFNQPIGGWDTSNVKAMHGMFAFASSFNQPIGDWSTKNVRNFAFMFAAASSFNQPIGSWDVEAVEDATSMFSEASSFNQPIGDWHIGNAHSIDEMLKNASKFNQDLCAWAQFKSVKGETIEANKELFKAAGGRRGRRKAALTKNSQEESNKDTKLYSTDASMMFEGTSCPEREDNDPTYTSNWCRKCTE
jgi:hypothetical protein